MKTPRLHRVSPGENLSDIARRYYGDKDARCMALFIWRHNQDIIKNPSTIYPGQWIVIPHVK